MLKAIGVTGKALLIDARLDENFAMSVRNIAARHAGAEQPASPPATWPTPARSCVTTAAMEKLEAALSA